MTELNGEMLTILGASIFVVALLYSCVGHCGASGYIAVMALFSLAPSVLKPTALLLNILVSSIATLAFARAGHFSWRLFWPFAMTSVPASLLGGYLSLPPHLYRPLVGMILLFSAYRLFFRPGSGDDNVSAPPLPGALAIGAVLGFVSGLTGVGGRHIPQPSPDAARMGTNQGSRRSVGALHPRQFHRRPYGAPQQPPVNSSHYSPDGDRGLCRRHHWFARRQPSPSPRSHRQNPLRCSCHCRRQADSDVTTPTA